MRKIVAVFLLLAMLTVFVSCGKGDNDETTGGGIVTGSPTMQPATTTTQPSTTDANAAATYILTTSPDRTVPWGETTRFSTTAASTTQPSTIIINIPTEGNTNPVTPNYSEAPTTTTKPTTTKPTATESTTVKPEELKAVSVQSSGGFNETEFLIDVDSSNWSSSFVANSKYLTVNVNGDPVDEKVQFKLSSTENSGYYTISADLSNLGLVDGSNVSVTIPEGFIKTKLGNEYNSEFTEYAIY